MVNFFALYWNAIFDFFSISNFYIWLYFFKETNPFKTQKGDFHCENWGLLYTLNNQTTLLLVIMKIKMSLRMRQYA
jgi:hypothetical protein